MDASSKIQGSIHVFRLINKYVSRILGTYQFSAVFTNFYYFNFQISLLYSAIVLSDEKYPAFAMFTSIIFFHF